MTLYSQVSAFRARCSLSHSPVRRLCRPTKAREKMIEGDGGRADIAGRLDIISAIVRNYYHERYMPNSLLGGRWYYCLTLLIKCGHTWRQHAWGDMQHVDGSSSRCHVMSTTWSAARTRSRVPFVMAVFHFSTRCAGLIQKIHTARTACRSPTSQSIEQSETTEQGRCDT